MYGTELSRDFYGMLLIYAAVVRRELVDLMTPVESALLQYADDLLMAYP